jgi:hypothetical protein
VIARTGFFSPIFFLGALFTVSPPLAARDSSAEDVDFFERKIRPVLVEHCYRCHSQGAKKVRGKLLLDTRDGVLTGGKTGPAIVPGDAAASLLLQALRYEKLEMPPKGQLPRGVITDFENWIERGAVDPRIATGAAARVKGGDSRGHWSYQPLVKPGLPEVKDAGGWASSPIDHFVLERLEQAGLRPSPRASRRVLLRRLSYDLIGLPPTEKEMEDFIGDPSADAYEKVVDRLLASPRYGERWGRHWLDVARYSDTKDLVLLFGRDRVRPYAYTYRDYVIRALNLDLPYDSFIADQLAGDRHQPGEDAWRQAAMGFLTLGRMFDNNPPDVYDDRIDTVTRGLLGLTVACARCHDHKYDSIPTEDYYSLYGIFSASEAPISLPVIGQPLNPGAFAGFKNKHDEISGKLRHHIDSRHELITRTARERTADYLVRAATTKPDVAETGVFFLSLSPEDLRPLLVARWRRYLEGRSSPADPVFGPWSELLAIQGDDFAGKASLVVKKWLSRATGTAEGQLNPLLRKALAEDVPRSRRALAALYGSVFKRVYQDWVKAAGKAELAEAERQLLVPLVSREGPLFIPRRLTYLHMSRVPRDQYGGFLKQLDGIAVGNSGAPPRAMVLVDGEDQRDPKVFVRGNPRRPGSSVPRRFLKVLSRGERPVFDEGSGRAELAGAITHPDNPLAARVMANRIWMHLLGAPLVSTPNDFGVRSDLPTHPRLLDWLARTLLDEGWSLKRLQRAIVLSSVYSQSSLGRAEAVAVDPVNRLFWRARRKRLDFEAMRDSLLAVAGRLDTRMGGPSVDIAKDMANRRRTVYGLVDRQELPGLFRSFDFPSPDQSIGRRSNTTVPQQALFAMNSSFLVVQARELARATGGPAARDRLEALYSRLYQRRPGDRERSEGLVFIEAASSGDSRQNFGAWEQYAQVLLLTNEFFFVD